MQKQRKLFLVGSGVARSFSPVMYNTAFRLAEFDAVYSVLDLKELEFERTIQEVLASPDVLGINLTIPFKEKVLPFLSEIDAQASAVGAVNVVKTNAEGKKRSGFNTDVDGVAVSLSRLGLLSSDSGHRRAVVLGAGGAARACVYALALNGYSRIRILNRTKERAETVSTHLSGRFPRVRFEPLELNQDGFVSALSGGCEVVVNALANSTSSLFPFDLAKLDFLLETGTRVFDLGYDSRPSLFLKLARDKGLKSTDGLPMLVEQAARSFEIWTGLLAPRQQMESAALEYRATLLSESVNKER